MTNFIKSTQLRIATIAILICGFTHAAKALEDKENLKGNSYFLNNFRCTADISVVTRSFLLKKDLGVQGGVGFGYYLLKFKHTQLGVWRNTLQTVTVDAGDGFISLEAGIRFPENQILEDKGPFTIREKSLRFPISVQLAFPDFFAGGNYTFFLFEYNPRYLLSAEYYPTSSGYDLAPGFQFPIPDLKKCCALNSFSHSFAFGAGFLFPFGMYLSTTLDIPIIDPNVATYLNAALINKPRRGLSYIEQTKGFCWDIRLGVDILMLIKKCQGNETERKRTHIFN